MMITSIQNNKYNTNFNAWNRVVYKSAVQTPKNIKHRNTTGFYRDDMNWRNFVTFLLEKYKDISKVNVYDYACSNGSEAYTFIMQLFGMCDESIAQKFIPIIAKDYDKIAIDEAKSNTLPIGLGEYNCMTYSLGEACKKFFYSNIPAFDSILINSQRDNKIEPVTIHMRDRYRDMVDFSVADIRKDYKNINPENSIVLARNFWPYMHGVEMYDLARNLYQQLQKNCCLVIGSFDTSNYFTTGKNWYFLNDMLSEIGFKRSPITFVYTKG